jgi:uncharacterized protein YjbJ (UPF0337 family)
MGADEKLGNAAKDVSGKIKEGVGRATDNPDLEAEGRAEQTEADLRQAGEKVKDALR